MSFWRNSILESIVPDNTVEVRVAEASVPLMTADAVEMDEKLTELGIWLSGLRSYLGSGNYLLQKPDGHAVGQYAATEFRIVHPGLSRCVLLIAHIRSSMESSERALSAEAEAVGDLREMAEALNEALQISESLIHSTVLGPGQWRAWSAMLNRRLGEIDSLYEVVHFAERKGARFLPKRLADLGSDARSISAEHAELILILPRFGMVLKWLSVIRKMLDADKPLKSTLLIFARVNELILDLTQYISNRLDRFQDHDAELFGTLDAASYTASIELKKVYSLELAGVASMRPPPSIYARIETAYSLLNDGFQQILAGFMRIVEPDIDIIDVFPEFHSKLEKSKVLRADLWSTLEIVKTAEKAPEPRSVETMKRALSNFRQGSMRYLFYKDTETVERFIEEILVTSQNKDLVPILHRFGAFLETLFGQVNLRSVLERHPFERADGM